MTSDQLPTSDDDDPEKQTTPAGTVRDLEDKAEEEAVVPPDEPRSS